MRISNIYSSFKDVKHGVHQGSVLGPLLFNIYICDLFFHIKDWQVANYADDTTPYVRGENIPEVISSLENCAVLLFEWFKNNYLQANSDKSHLICSTNEIVQANINSDIICASKSEKLLRVTIDCNLSFEEHVKKLCNKASQKLSALARISSYMCTKQKRRILKAFITSQFGYCPLIWMFCSRNLNNRINVYMKEL